MHVGAYKRRRATDMLTVFIFEFSCSIMGERKAALSYVLGPDIWGPGLGVQRAAFTLTLGLIGLRALTVALLGASAVKPRCSYYDDYNQTYGFLDQTRSPETCICWPPLTSGMVRNRYTRALNSEISTDFPFAFA